jgi:rhamnosyltransferase
MTPSPSSVQAVVVTYLPRAETVDNLRALTSQLEAVVVVDNSPVESSAAVLAEIERLPRVQVVRNGRNLGIAAALNRGIQIARQSGREWVATFDQDSCVTPGFFAGLLAAYGQCPDREQVALVSPAFVYPEAPAPAKPDTEPPPETSLILTAMTSGSLIRTEVFAKLGGYDEDLFIDYVDYDHCLRMQAAGYRLRRANRVFLQHRLGTPQKHRLLGREIAIKAHSAWRRYYITRNRLLVYRRYALQFPRWCLHDFGWFFLELGKVLVFEADKLTKLRNILKGLIHGILGKTGPRLPPS